MEGDVFTTTIYLLESNFYPRPHMEGDGYNLYTGCIQTDFYPRPHMEGDFLSYIWDQKAAISTHALTWRATWMCL